MARPQLTAKSDFLFRKQLDAWQANGGTVKVVCDGPGNITFVRYVIQRTHRAL